MLIGVVQGPSEIHFFVERSSAGQSSLPQVAEQNVCVKRFIAPLLEKGMLLTKRTLLVVVVCFLLLQTLCSASVRPIRRKKKAQGRQRLASSRSLQGGNGKAKGKGGSSGDLVECQIWPWKGDCISTPELSLAGAVELLFCGNPDVDFVQTPIPAFACDAYKRYIKNLLDLIPGTNPGYPVAAACTGEFSGEEIKAESTAKDLGCTEIPVADSQNYGVVAAKFDGGAVVPVSTKACIMASPPDCGFMFGVSTSAGITNYLFGLIAAPVGGPAAVLAASILSLVTSVNKLVFGISERGLLETPIEVYTPDGFVTDTQLTNFFFKSRLSNVFLPAAVNSIIPTSFEAGTYWAWPPADVESNIAALGNGADPVSMGLQYSTAFVRILNTKFKLSSYTLNILPDLDLAKVTETGYYVRNDFGLMGEFPNGYYTSYGSQVPVISDNLKLICDAFAAFGVECPTVFEIDPSSKMGWYLQDSGAFGFKIDWKGILEVECVNTGQLPEFVECETADGRNIQLFNNRRGLSAKIVNVVPEQEDAVPVLEFQVSQDAVSVYGNKLTKEAGRFFQSLYRLSDPDHEGSRKLQETAFGFQKGRTCAANSETDMTLFDSRDGNFAYYSAQHGHDGSLRNCFAACIVQAQNSTTTKNSCCEYRKLEGENHVACYLKEFQSDNMGNLFSDDIFASTSFSEDFESMVGNL